MIQLSMVQVICSWIQHVCKVVLYKHQYMRKWCKLTWSHVLLVLCLLFHKMVQPHNIIYVLKDFLISYERMSKNWLLYLWRMLMIFPIFMEDVTSFFHLLLIITLYYIYISLFLNRNRSSCHFNMRGSSTFLWLDG